MSAGDARQRPAEGTTVDARQRAWLVHCLATNAGCAFARGLGLDAGTSVADFRARVPLTDYARLRPWIVRVADGEPDVLFAGRAVAFEETGGSTGGRKLIPYSAAALHDIAAAVVPWLARLIEDHQVGPGQAYWAISPVLRRPRHCAGVPVGLSDAGYLGDEGARLVGATSAVPAWLAGLRDHAQWRLATLHHLVRNRRLRLISVWSPTFLLLLLDHLTAAPDELIGALRDGREVVGYPLVPDPAALTRYRRFLDTGDTRTLWHELRLLSCWTDAASRPFGDQLAARLPQARLQPKGLLLTEGVVTVPDAEDRPLLAADSGFFEFIDRDGDPRLAGELRAGDCYEVVMTTAGGLYRYRSGDQICCEGYAGDLPILRFVGRTALTSDLVGEKLTEAFVAQCLSALEGFRMLVPMREPAGYALVVDADPAVHLAAAQRLERIEASLCGNPQYAYARRLGQLASLCLLPTTAPLTRYVAHREAQGARLGDIKVPALTADTDWLGPLERRQR